MRGARLKYTHDRNATESSERVCHHTLIGPVNVTTALAVAGWVLCCSGKKPHCLFVCLCKHRQIRGCGSWFVFSFFLATWKIAILSYNTCTQYFTHVVVFHFTWRWVSQCTTMAIPSLGPSLDAWRRMDLQFQIPIFFFSLSPGVQMQFLIAIQEGGSFLRKWGTSIFTSTSILLICT